MTNDVSTTLGEQRSISFSCYYNFFVRQVVAGSAKIIECTLVVLLHWRDFNMVIVREKRRRRITFTV